MSQDEAVLRLARQIEAARKSESFLADPDAVAAVRRGAACELHRVCAEFVASVNGRLSDAHLDLSPPTYAPEIFRDTAVNLFQVSSQGREMQLIFEAPPQLFSTEKFLAPYTLEGEIRTYNQQMLDRFEIRSRMIFFCVDERTTGWRSFDWRTRHTGPVDVKLLVSLMEPLF